MSDAKPTNSIGPGVRRDFFDVFRVLKTEWSGSLGDEAFMARLYDLEELESFDSRYKTASGDIYQHMVMNRDWSDDWPLSDGRFRLDRCSDARFLRFVCESLHPAVRGDPDEVERLAPAINEALAQSAWQVAGTASLAGRPVYRPRRVIVRSTMKYRSDDKEAAYRTELEKRGFSLKGRLGSGAYGVVFRAEQTSLRREVAIKFFDAFSPRDETSRKRFERESMLMARVEHPSIPYVVTRGEIRFDKIDPVPYFVMQFVRGETLEEVLRREEMVDEVKAGSLALDLLGALAEAHSNDVVHRDIKPSNIMLRKDRAFLVDFSIGVDLHPDAPGLTRATRTGHAVGTTHYAAPEQMRDSSRVDHRADLFSVGVVLAEMLGVPPPVRLDLLDAALPDASSSLRDLLRKALAADPEERVASAGAFRTEVETVFHREGARSLSEPATVLCTNTSCLDAQWSESRGYYIGPKIVHDSTDRFCAACGEQYVRACRRCRARISQDVEKYLVRKGKGVPGLEAHCSGCGGPLFRVPTCPKCRSFLLPQDLQRDAVLEEGCGKCWEPPRRAPAADDFPPDDDIPF